MLKTTLKIGITLSFILGLFVNTPTIAQEVYLDNNCKQNQKLGDSDRFTLFYKSEFPTKGKTYWFYAGRYQDGSTIICLSQPGFKQARPLNEVEPIQNNYVDKITRDSRNKTAFLIITHDGNGSYVPMNEYRLNLSTPAKPVLTKLRTWKSKS